eukprot:GGOE01041866.1.p1 GENE.GGOE01041866.1~~GGOE01041866.1.p1  ORF type:complete len:261 (-),score=30.15 GGOE01041866.1:134-916(-)
MDVAVAPPRDPAIQQWVADPNHGAPAENDLAEWYHTRQGKGRRALLSLNYKEPVSKARHGHVAPHGAPSKAQSRSRSPAPQWEMSAQPAGIPEYDALKDRHIRGTRSGRFLRRMGKTIAYQQEVQRAKKMNIRHRREGPLATAIREDMEVESQGSGPRRGAPHLAPGTVSLPAVTHPPGSERSLPAAAPAKLALHTRSASGAAQASSTACCGGTVLRPGAACRGPAVVAARQRLQLPALPASTQAVAPVMKQKEEFNLLL